MTAQDHRYIRPSAPAVGKPHFVASGTADRIVVTCSLSHIPNQVPCAPPIAGRRRHRHKSRSSGVPKLSVLSTLAEPPAGSYEPAHKVIDLSRSAIFLHRRPRAGSVG